jgi:hypothetical protein
MKLSELIQYIGDDHVELQTMARSLVRASIKKKDGEVTFAADREKVAAMCGVGKPTHMGLVLWLPIDRLPEEIRPKSKEG